MQPDMVTAAEAGAILGCSPRTVARMADDGRLTPAMQLPGITGALLFRRADVLTYKESREPSEAAS